MRTLRQSVLNIKQRLKLNRLNEKYRNVEGLGGYAIAYLLFSHFIFRPVKAMKG